MDPVGEGAQIFGEFTTTRLRRDFEGETSRRRGLDGGSTARSGVSYGGGFVGGKGVGATVENREATGDDRLERGVLVRASNMQVGGGGAEKNSGELLRPLEFMIRLALLGGAGVGCGEALGSEMGENGGV